ncbi:DDE superfamily endonuclease [Phytophthora infestans]|uniref:DDE superfamily endonuclease n=1 Tax=Phytophthora infestans TaxID=4787 RepID=A0A833WMQ5_PHYIN|nr:DDE superfamily endonuclease [Phytophthora infestans]KAF4145356.1 DDE superfamily endonuclease [Phytophthora infestans]
MLTSLSHPLQSPDSNPIENLWSEMKRELSRSSASSLEDLQVKLQRIWSTIDDDSARKTVRLIPKRLDVVKE